MTKLEITLAGAMLVAACGSESPSTGTVRSHGMLNGMLNGMQHYEGLSAYLATECPLLEQRLLHTGNLAQPFSEDIVEEISVPACDRFMFYTVQLMASLGEQVTLATAVGPVATYTGVVGMQQIVRQVDPSYSFGAHAFMPAHPIARTVVTHGYAALTNGAPRIVSYKANIAALPELDMHRTPIEDTYPREFLQLVPFKPAALQLMASSPAFLARQPDFFKPCFPELTNYDYMSCTPAAGLARGSRHAKVGVDAGISDAGSGSDAGIDAGIPDAGSGSGSDAGSDAPSPLPWESACDLSEPTVPLGYCPVPIVVHGNLAFTDDIVPKRTCRIRRHGEPIPPGHTVNGDVIIPPGGCPLVYYPGRVVDETVYDDRTRNASGSTDGCDMVGPSTLANCDFDVVDEGGLEVPDEFLEYFVFNVEPM